MSGAAILAGGGSIGVGDAPSLLFHGTNDPLVPYAWAQNTWTAANNAGLDSFLTTWPGAGHVPYATFKTQIINQTTNFLYGELDLANAAQ